MIDPDLPAMLAKAGIATAEQAERLAALIAEAQRDEFRPMLEHRAALDLQLDTKRS